MAEKIWKKLFCLPPVPTLLISIPAYGLVIYVLDIPLVSKYLREDMFRAETGLYQGFFINLVYAGIKIFSGIFYRSVWFITLAVYYILLAVMRASLLHYVRKEEKDKVSEWKRYRLCGIILLFMNIALAGIVILVINQNSGFEYPGMLIYVMSAAKVINLTAALVSMLSLETAMVTQFGAADDPLFRQIMTGSTGVGISIIVLGMAVFRIVRSTKQMRYIKREKEMDV